MAEFALRWFHFLAGITWIGLLYYFNFVQGPFMAEADPATKSAVIQKLVPRALWWFRWSALLTWLTGAAVIGDRMGRATIGSAAWASNWAVTILTGALFGTVMLINVWAVIWRNQKIVIESAKTAASGGQANAAAPAAARRAFLASRTNVVFSIPMLYFMGAASHNTLPAAGNHGLYWLAMLVLVGVIEANALRATSGPTTKPIEKIPGVIVTGFVVWAIAYVVGRAILSA